MKKLFAFVCLSICTVAFAQDYKKNIEADFNAYLDLILNKEFEKSTDYLIPEFFEIFPKADLIAVMDETFNNPSIAFEFKNPKILSVNDAQAIENRHYALLTYSSQMNMKIHGEADETEEDKQATIDMTRQFLVPTYGEENVAYNETTGFFEIQTQKDVYAISDNGTTDWKFLVIEKEQKDILGKLLPKVLADKL